MVFFKVWNIDKYEYIGIWILRIYGEYLRNINKTKIIQNSWKYLKKLEKMINK